MQTGAIGFHVSPDGSIGPFLRILYSQFLPRRPAACKAFVTMRISMGGMIKSFLGHVLPKVILPLRILWNEMIGFLFLLIAVPAILSAIKYFRKVEQDADNLFWAFLTAIFAAVMVFFGIHSFVRARRISRL
jgi:hypothetical protein